MGPSISDLRRRIRRMEGRLDETLGQEAGPAVLGLGCPEADARFETGGLTPGAHQAAGPAGTPFAFVCTLLARLADVRPGRRVLLVQEAGALREAGGVYGPGLQAMGVDPASVALLGVKSGAEALRAGDEAMKSGAAAAVVIELCEGEGLADLSLTRRFNLSAEKSGAFLFLVTPHLEATSAALTRWRVAPAATVGRKRRLGAPAFDLTLTRNRLGRLGRWTLEWNSDERRFRPLDASAAGEAVPAPVALSAGDRPGASERSERRPAASGRPAGAYRQAG
jgi:protein ImuA